MKINSRVWRRFLQKVGSAFLTVLSGAVYVLFIWFLSSYAATQLGYDPLLVLFAASIFSIFVPLICWILYGEYKLTKTEIEIEDKLVMMSLKKGVGGFDDRGV